jgi:hypothetical protein
MKRILYIITAVALCMSLGVQAKGKKEKTDNKGAKALVVVPQMYAYSVASSPMDSVVYMTDVLILKGAQMTKKTKFLVGRQDYSSQFKNFLAEIDLPNRTCATMYNVNHRKAFKEYEKLKKSLTKRGFTIKVIDQTEFRYIVTSHN